MILPLFAFFFIVTLALIFIGYKSEIPLLLLMASVMFFILGITLMFDGVQAADLIQPTTLDKAAVENALQITRYTPYCDHCWFCYKTNETKLTTTIAVKDISYKTVEYLEAKPIALDIKPQYTTVNDGTEFCYYWERTNDKVIDILPTVLGYEITKWATWSPTSYEILFPTEGTILDGMEWVNVSFLNSLKGELYFWYENTTDGVNSTQVIMYGDNYISMDNKSVGYYYKPTSSAGGWITPGNWTWDYGVMVGGNGNDDLFALWGPNTGAMDYFITCGPSSTENCSALITMDDIDTSLGIERNVLVYAYWANNYRECEISFDNVTYYNTDSDLGCEGWSWCNFTQDSGAITGNQIYVRMPNVVSDGCYLSGTRWINTDNEFHELLNTSLIQDGGYRFWFNATNSTGEAENITAVGCTILQSPGLPSCLSANIDTTHWQMDIDKYITTDAALSASGCIRENRWANGTRFNESWITCTDNYVNESGVVPLEFYGIHYLAYYCNDSIDVWVSCGDDQFELSESGGITAEQNATLYSIPDDLKLVKLNAMKELMATDYVCLDESILETSDIFDVDGALTTLRINTTCSNGCVNATGTNGVRGYCRETRSIFIEAIGVIFILLFIVFLIEGFRTRGKIV